MGLILMLQKNQNCEKKKNSTMKVMFAVICML